MENSYTRAFATFMRWQDHAAITSSGIGQQIVDLFFCGCESAERTLKVEIIQPKKFVLAALGVTYVCFSSEASPEELDQVEQNCSHFKQGIDAFGNLIAVTVKPSDTDILGPLLGELENKLITTLLNHDNDEEPTIN